MRTLLRDDWDQLARDTIEKVCDRFGISIGDLFELVPDGFWDPFIEQGEYYILRGEYEPRDAKARTIITNYLADRFPSLTGSSRSDIKDQETVVKYSSEHNCIVVGSPKSNPVTELVVTALFNAKPFDASLENRLKIPARFVFPSSAPAISALAEPQGQLGGVGICDQAASRLVAVSDWWAREEYLAQSLSRARDCALVVILTRPFGASRSVKTIVLAGFSGIGTEAAAIALVRDFRHLQPDPDTGYTVGALEATYKKPTPNQDSRVLLGYRWKMLSSGRKRFGLEREAAPLAGDAAS